MLQRLAKWILHVTNWRPVEKLPDVDKGVFIAASHTSNWDGLWLILFKISMDVKLRFFAKHTLFWWPLGSILRSLGALPIDRSRAASTVSQMINAFAQEDRLWLALAPEGTRKWRPYWKTGFYQIAQAAGVPIYLAFIDYREKRMGVGARLVPSGNQEQDLEIIREFYKPFMPRHPELKGPIAFPPS